MQVFTVSLQDAAWCNKDLQGGQMVDHVVRDNVAIYVGIWLGV